MLTIYTSGIKNTINGDFDVAIPEGTSGKFDYVRGESKYKEKLKPKK
ncbi:MAG: hypothetical protein IPM77_17480 [Crocinitomicaceae bacterium]|nr:hypothetical protein [Crocinitomicaceae bacterium]